LAAEGDVAEALPGDAATPEPATPTPAEPEEPSAAPEEPKAESEESKLGLDVKGFCAFTAYSQNNFFLGKGAPGLVSDKDAYSIQIFRLQPELSYGPDVKAVLRMDIAQGIWGLDDALRDNDRPGFQNLFSRKDTSFLLHVDWAYLQVSPAALDHWTFRVGRMKNKAGRLLVIDQNADGVQVSKKFDSWDVNFSWAKMFEGVDGLTDSTFDNLDGKDTDLFSVEFGKVGERYEIRPYLAYYTDRGGSDGKTYIPNGLQFSRPRFTPNLSEVFTIGASYSFTIGKLKLLGDAAYLTGEDKVPNEDSGPREVLDVNNGDLSGYTFYLDASLPTVSAGTFGARFGIGSGDDDYMSGKGNITKIKTNGHFFITEVWEESTMPDEEGITPQGLGSPASRAYREFENTTLFQLNYARLLGKHFSVYASGTVMRATEAIQSWSDQNDNGVIEPGELGPESSKDLGWELDGRVTWNVMKKVAFILRAGVFVPGAAAGYLINGTDQWLESAWELRGTLRFNFGGKAF